MKIKLSESTLSEMIQKAVTKVLKEDIYDNFKGETLKVNDYVSFTQKGVYYYGKIVSINGDTAEVEYEFSGEDRKDSIPLELLSKIDTSGFNPSKERGPNPEQLSQNDLNMQAKYNDGSYNDSIISTSEAIAIANKAGQIVLDAKDAIMEVAYIYDEDDVPMYKIEEILAEYDMTMDDLNEIEDSNPTFESKSPKVIKVKMNELRQVIAQIIKEEEEAKSIDRRIPKIQRLVDEINHLISQAIDSDGEPIAVIDTTNTWQSPMVYNQIIYSKNGSLKISNSYPMEPRKGIETDIIRMRDMEFDGIPTLLLIRRLYKKALKQNIE